MTWKILAPGTLGMLLALGSVAVAHHSTAAYQNKTIVVKQARIRKFGWANPHSILGFDVKDQSGRVTTWSVESGSPSALSRIGWNRNSLTPGDLVTIELFPAKNGSHVGRLARVILRDGRELQDSLYKDSPFETIQKK